VAELQELGLHSGVWRRELGVGRAGAYCTSYVGAHGHRGGSGSGADGVGGRDAAEASRHAQGDCGQVRRRGRVCERQRRGECMRWSQYQQAIFNAVRDSRESLLVEAVAGSGKTTTIVEAINYVPEGESVCFLAFNKSIATELGWRVTRP